MLHNGYNETMLEWNTEIIQERDTMITVIEADTPG